MTDFEKKLETVESNLTFLENFVHELGEVVAEQSKKISKLENENIIMKKRILELSNGNLFGQQIPNEKPPHY